MAPAVHQQLKGGVTPENRQAERGQNFWGLFSPKHVQINN